MSIPILNKFCNFAALSICFRIMLSKFANTEYVLRHSVRKRSFLAETNDNGTANGLPGHDGWIARSSESCPVLFYHGLC